MNTVDDFSIMAAAFALIMYTPIGILLYKKLALPNILRVADSNRARTLELLRRGVGIIPLTEHKMLLNQHRALADLRAHVAECGLGPLAGLHRGMRDWLKNVRALQEAVEEAFERYESEDIARLLSDNDTNKPVQALVDCVCPCTD